MIKIDQVNYVYQYDQDDQVNPDYQDNPDFQDD